MGALTVRQNIRFSAALRLPSNMSNREREQRVQSVIDELGLTACADTKVMSFVFIIFHILSFVFLCFPCDISFDVLMFVIGIEIYV